MVGKVFEDVVEEEALVNEGPILLDALVSSHQQLMVQVKVAFTQVLVMDLQEHFPMVEEGLVVLESDLFL